MASIIARALQAHEVHLKQEWEARQQEEQAQKVALTTLLERVRPFYTDAWERFSTTSYPQ